MVMSAASVIAPLGVATLVPEFRAKPPVPVLLIVALTKMLLPAVSVKP